MHGGHPKEIHIGDIIIGESCINIGSFITREYDENIGTNINEWKQIAWYEENDIENEKISADKQLVETIEKVINRNKRVIKGTIGSSDIWNKEVDRIKWLVENLDTKCEDMETYAVYKIANQNNIPAIGIRIISNSQINSEKYDKSLAKNLQIKILEIIKEI